MNLRLAAHWTATTTTAAAAVSTAAAIPFTGPAAGAAGLLAAAGVCLIGIATAPALNTRKEKR
ncbi:hypothetical protein AB0M11_26320 [Streptomyces sp. NPDC051987]|uniref:hypothetical protein n=1 Tax=Streptomyces sp. NPDC051987 TaxID=3155808 RepID=UPI00344353B7